MAKSKTMRKRSSNAPMAGNEALIVRADFNQFPTVRPGMVKHDLLGEFIQHFGADHLAHVLTGVGFLVKAAEGRRPG